MFTAGSEISSATTVWAMVENVKNPRIFTKAQAEVRDVFRDKVMFDINDIEELKCLKEETCINCYNIPVKTTIIVNVWALGRDPKYWDDAESFIPEIFEQCSVDFIGNNFEYLPFGGGKRICRGISFGFANVYLLLAQLLYHFDWKFPTGIKTRDLNLTESFGIVARKKVDLNEKNKVQTPPVPPDPPNKLTQDAHSATNGNTSRWDVISRILNSVGTAVAPDMATYSKSREMWQR
ncbi:putative premnaspirodiene oxygenase-like [Capsicum annuum]|nr:putative premnaspirodiene oxygenase-like [Capsicum annuum]KAF3652037.1 putative premnaspirodiene oxygenase-like [Capsicum annuum]